MTVIQDRIEDVAGEGVYRRVVFHTNLIRESADGTAIVAPVRHRFELDDGELLTTDLDPGPAIVEVAGDTYQIVIPDSSSTVRLWPLIDTLVTPAPTPSTGYVKDGGGVARIQALTQAEYNSLTVDPATLYVITD